MRETDRQTAQSNGTVDELVAASVPVTFGGTIGLFCPAAAAKPCADMAALFVSPWGFEEMCSRKFFRMTAEALALEGMASLRFDYPDTGDALDIENPQHDISVWETTVAEAAATLRRISGCQKLIIIAQGLGVPLAMAASRRIGGDLSFALLCPVLSGRAYLRETALWTKVIDSELGLQEQKQDQSGVSIASLKMSEGIAADVRKINLMTLEEKPGNACLLMTRPGRPQDAEFGARLQTLGMQVQQEPFEGYEQMIANATHSGVPTDAVAIVTRWAASLRTGSIASQTPVIIGPEECLPLHGDAFLETPVRFGPGNRLYGILCKPEGEHLGASVIIMTTAYERHSSWGRMNAYLARDLARSGIASLRFDTAGVADSPPLPDAPEEVLYSASQQADTAAAIAFMQSQNLGPVITTGRCSGGYLAFRTALHQSCVKGAVAANPYVFYWNPARCVQKELKFVPERLSAYAPKLLKMATFRRIMSGEIHLKAAIVNISRVVLKKIIAMLGPLSAVIPGSTAEEHRIVRAAFVDLARRHVDIALMYSNGDSSQRHLEEHFGPKGERLKSFSNVSIVTLDGVDHNFTPAHARALYLQTIIAMARKHRD
jgi:Serine aminopeptidase, S33